MRLPIKRKRSRWSVTSMIFRTTATCRLWFVECDVLGDGRRAGLLPRMLFDVVVGEEVVAEVAFEIAENAVDVVAVALRVVELDQEGGALDAIVGLLGAI